MLIVSLLLSGGTHWLVLQSVAWTTMLVARASETSLVEAVKQTFDGAHPCALCKTIEKGRAGEKQHDGAVLTAKIQLFHEPTRLAFFPPIPRAWLPTAAVAAQTRTDAPHLRPPRLG